MLSLSEIRRDLSEIRYYYSRREVFDEAFRTVSANSILDKVKKYNAVIAVAPPRLYDLYIGLYVKNATQEGLSIELGYSPHRIYELNKQLLLFLQEKSSGLL